MKVTALELGQILNNGRRTALLPARDDSVHDKAVRQRVHRRGGRTVCYVKITDAQLVGPLEEYVDDQYARAAGHLTADAYRDEWCRTHDAAWTGSDAWEVTFTVEPWREQTQPMRGPWDPGDELTGRGRAPEPEKVDHRPIAEKAREKWELDQQQREAVYRALPLDQRVAMAIRDARSAGIDTTLLEKSIDKRVESLRSKTRRAA